MAIESGILEEYQQRPDSQYRAVSQFVSKLFFQNRLESFEPLKKDSRSLAPNKEELVFHISPMCAVNLEEWINFINMLRDEGSVDWNGRTYLPPQISFRFDPAIRPGILYTEDILGIENGILQSVAKYDRSRGGNSQNQCLVRNSLRIWPGPVTAELNKTIQVVKVEGPIDIEKPTVRDLIRATDAMGDQDLKYRFISEWQKLSRLHGKT